MFGGQLAAVLNPREGPSRWEEEEEGAPDEAFVLRLLVELSGAPEVRQTLSVMLLLACFEVFRGVLRCDAFGMFRDGFDLAIGCVRAE